MNLDKIIAPLINVDFLKNKYEKEWSILGEPSESITGLFDFEQLEEYLFVARPWDSSKNDFRCAKYPEKSFEPNANSVEDVIDLYSQGYSLILNCVHHRHQNIAKVCAKLSNQFFGAVQANVYVSPAGGQGFEAHYDSHDVFVFQVKGKKTWQLQKDPSNPLIQVGEKFLEEYKFDDPRETIKSGETITLNEGEILYVPRGTIHKAFATGDGPSIHITFSVFPVTWIKVIQSCLLDGALNDLELLRTVPMDVLSNLDSPETQELVKAKLLKAFDNSDPISTWRFIHNRDNVLLPGGGINSLLQIDALNSTSKISVRECADIFIGKGPRGYWVTFSRRRYNVPEGAIPYLEYISEHSNFRIENLPGSDTMIHSKIAFVKWLLNNGLGRIINVSD
jgi:hypothetical protein